MNKKESLQNQLTDLSNEANFHKALKTVFNSPEGIAVFDWILNLGNFGGIIKGDLACGAYSVSSQIWVAVMKASPETVKAIIDMRHEEVQNNRQQQFKQIEAQLKEVDDE